MTVTFLKALLERAIRAAAAAVVSALGLDTFGAIDVDRIGWTNMGKIALGAAFVSTMISLAASQWGDQNSTSFIPPTTGKH